ncbi:MAG: flavin reductase family protein [Candidatus Dormibacteraeota bacterium]|nr:flavin reductase family protein [Candidatus Dormibacteraeota bacterium]
MPAGESLGPVSASLYREIMARFPSGVAIVTAHEAGGSPRGLTLSAFCAVSLEPPLVLACVDRTSNTLPALQAAGGFTVNFLAAGKEHLAVLYASKQEEKFAGIAWSRPSIPEGGPILHEDCAAYAVCVTRQALEAGDHWIFVGEVREGRVIPGRRPLVYHKRSFVDLRDPDE